MPYPTIIALTGLAGTGKDSVADILVRHASFHKLAFADALRHEVTEAYRLRMDDTIALLTDRAAKETPTQRLALTECSDFGFIGAVALATRATVSQDWCNAPRSPRQIMQWWGTEYRRAQRVDYWTHRLADHIRQLHKLDGRDRFVIPDCRFENEATMVRRRGGLVWQVCRAGIESVEGNHASQTDGSKLGPDNIIDNHASLDVLRDQVMAEWTAQLQAEVARATEALAP